MKRILSGIIALSLLLAPMTVLAQTASCNSVTDANFNACCVNNANTTEAGRVACENYYSNGGGSSAPGTTATGTTGSGVNTAGSAVRYNPNINFSSGNTYGGGAISISGVGGAIASCTNIGGFLVNGISSLLGQTSLTQKASSAFSFTGGQQAVATSDKTTQNAVNNINRTQQCLNGIAYAIAKNTLAQITTKTLNWVNTGLNGNPLYVQNVGSYLTSVKNQQLRTFLGTVQTSNPIFGNALQSAITYQSTGLSNGRLNIAMNTPQAQGYNSFMTDFTNGGWSALINPFYNPVGALFNASDQLAYNTYTQQQLSQNEIQRNNGFLDMKRCVQYANNGIATTAGAQCNTVSDDATYEACCTGQSAEDSVACNNYAVTDDGGNAECSNITDDKVYQDCCNGNAGDSAVCVAYDNYEGTDTGGAPQNSIATTNGAALHGAPQCTQYVTDTPGSIIANQVSTITTTTTRQLEYANQINEVLGSFFDSFVNNLLSKGLRGSGSNQSIATNFAAEGNNTVTDANGNALDTSNAAESALGYQDTSSAGNAITADFDISRPQELRAIIQTQYNFLNRTEDAQVAVNRIIPAIGALDYCIPGPNPDWQTNTDSNWQTFIGDIQQANPKDQSTVEKLVGSLPVVGSFVDSLISIFTGSGKAPELWSSTPVLTDKITGQGVQISRTLYAPDGHGDGTTTSDLEGGLQNAYQQTIQQYQWFLQGANTNTFAGSPVGNAFQQAAANDGDTSYVDGFLQDAYINTDSIVGYNQAATTINQQYQQEVSDSENNIQQLEDIRKQIDGIVATAKARYIQENPGINLTCLNNAYQIDTSPIVGVARQENDPSVPSGNALRNEENQLIQHANTSASDFYNNQIK